MLAKSIRADIYNIYGFVRFADEIVDSFHDYDKKILFNNFSRDMEEALDNRISLNPILNSFQYTYHKYQIDKHLVDSFMESMRLDLHKSNYLTEEEFKKYIYTMNINFKPNDKVKIIFNRYGKQKETEILFSSDPSYVISTFEAVGKQPTEMQLANRKQWLYTKVD